MRNLLPDTKLLLAAPAFSSGLWNLIHRFTDQILKTPLLQWQFNINACSQFICLQVSTYLLDICFVQGHFATGSHINEKIISINIISVPFWNKEIVVLIENHVISKHLFVPYSPGDFSEKLEIYYIVSNIIRKSLVAGHQIETLKNTGDRCQRTLVVSLFHIPYIQIYFIHSL